MNEKRDLTDFEKLLERFLMEEGEASDVFILWTKPDKSGHEVIVRGDILGLAGKLDYVTFAWKMNLFHSTINRQKAQNIIVPPHIMGRRQ